MVFVPLVAFLLVLLEGASLSCFILTGVCLRVGDWVQCLVYVLCRDVIEYDHGRPWQVVQCIYAT